MVNLGSRFCAQAADGQILIDGRVQLAVESMAVAWRPLGELDLKGLHRPIRAFNVHALKLVRWPLCETAAA